MEPESYRRLIQEGATIAYCPEHGLHGERTECFVCGGSVARIRMFPPPSPWKARGERAYLVALGITMVMASTLDGWWRLSTLVFLGFAIEAIWRG